MKKYKYTKTFSFEGKKYYIHGDSLEEVYEKKARRLQQLESGRVLISKDMPVSAWAEQALDTYKVNVSTDSLKDTKLRLQKHVFSEIGNLPLRSVTPLHCQRIMNNQQSMSYSHITKVYQEMHFIFEKAVENHLLLQNPVDNITKPKGIKGVRRSLTENELEHFKKISADTNEYMLFELMLYCGCRPGEAMICRRDDIEDIKGKHMLHIRGTKTVNADRYVPFPNSLYQKVEHLTADALLAPNKAGRKHSTSSYNRLSANLRRAMNISMGCKLYRNELVPPYPLAEDFVPYNFRHTYCTNLARSGVDIRTAQKLMGHANIQLTANIYTHVDMNDILKAADIIEKHQTI